MFFLFLLILNALFLNYFKKSHHNFQLLEINGGFLRFIILISNKLADFILKFLMPFKTRRAIDNYYAKNLK